MPAPGDTVGIMSDSHGRPALIEAAVRILRGRGCARLFHLGDICDSGKPSLVVNNTPQKLPLTVM